MNKIQEPADSFDKMLRVQARSIQIDPLFALAQTAAPAAWAKGRWANHDWINGTLVWVGQEDDATVWLAIRQPAAGTLHISGTARPDSDWQLLTSMLGVEDQMPKFADPILRSIARRYPGLRPFAAGSIYEGLVSSIIGQSITVMAAAVVERRVAELFNPAHLLAGRTFVPLPSASDLAGADPAALRATGLTWRRAHALIAIAQAELEGAIPNGDDLAADPQAVRARLRQLPLVGPWTVESALLWGVGEADAHPTRDVALLRAAKAHYQLPDLDLNGLDQLAEQWRPNRGWAARLLWTSLLGPAES